MRSRLRWMTLLTTAVLSLPAHGQLRLGASGLPGLPLQGLPHAVGQVTGQVDAIAADGTNSVRQLAAARLLRTHRRILDADSHGNPIVRNEILAVDPTAASLAIAGTLGFVVVREQAIPEGILRIVVLQAPGNLSTARALQRLRAADPPGTYDFNHLYAGAGTATAIADSPATPAPAGSVDSGQPGSSDTAASPIRVGLVDTGIDESHPALARDSIQVGGCSGKTIAAAHGTAIASLLSTHAGLELYAVDVYCGLPTGGSIDAITAAFAWLLERRVAVINVSLVGPNNVVLEHVIRTLIDRGYLIVAAVGNDGPNAPPLYPAAYPDVVGVTAVDARRRVLVEALRGPQVMFAAQGADLEAAGLRHTTGPVRGTSFAAPRVAVLLAALLTTPDHAAAQSAVATLAASAIDLGAPGRDLTYGYGLVGAQAR